MTQIDSSVNPELRGLLDRVANNHELGITPPITIGRRWDTLLNIVWELRAQSGTYFLKFARSGGDLHTEFERTQALRAAVRGGPTGRYTCVEAMVYFDSPESLLVRGVPGSSFQDLIATACRWQAAVPLGPTCEAAEEVGRWLRQLEDASLNTSSAASVWNHLNEEVKVAAENTLRNRASRSARSLSLICSRHIGDAYLQASEPEVYLAHRDFHPGNLFVTSDRERQVSVIDCRLSTPQFVGYDALLMDFHFVMDYSVRKYDPRRIARVRAAFRRGYGRPLLATSAGVRAACAAIVMHSVVYLTTAQQQSLLGKISAAMDLRRAGRWLRQMAGE